jgi:hypothetical protein
VEGEGRQFNTSGPMGFAITLNVQTNVYVVDQPNWSRLQSGQEFHYVDGKHATHGPTVVHVPRAGRWWIFIEATGQPIRYSIQPLY